MVVEKLLVVVVTFLIGLWNLGLTIYVYKKNPEKRINKNFASVGGILSLWAFCNCLIWATQDILWLSTSYALSSLLPVAALSFVYALVEKKFNKIIKYVFTFLGLLFFALSYTPLLIKGAEKIVFETRWEAVEASFGGAFIFWSAYLLFAGLFSIYILLKSLFEVGEEKKSRIGYFIGGGVIFITVNVIVNIVLPFFGVSRLAFLGAFSTIFVTVTASYAIVKHQMMGVETKFFRAFLYSLGIALLTGLVSLMIFLGSWLLDYLGALWVWLSSIVVALIVGGIGMSYFQKAQALQESKDTLEERVESQTEELKKLNEELEQRVKERTQELRESKQELQEKIQELEKFHDTTVERELKMVELKKKTERLEKKLRKEQEKSSS